MRRLAAFAVVLAAALVAAPAGAAGLPTSRHVLLGRSTQGRPIRAVRLGDPASPRKALVIGNIHGDEPAGVRIARALRRRSASVKGIDLWVIETVNPDGLRRGVRQNARGVDLNRNFPFRWQPTTRGTRYYGGRRPLSERESRVIYRWIPRIQPAVTIWYHQPWGAVLVPCHGKAPIERRYARRAHSPTSCRGDGLRGTAMTWQNDRFPRGHAFVVELAGGGVTATVVRRHTRAALLAATGR
jgi:protein MpaA